uniref:Uncharacterized protein n=1 Tax=Caenorhabditis japonica TaxID=281687 RepID=A0A8R1E4F4_CAEJA
MSLPYIFLCFPRDKRLTVYQQIEANEHARYMYQFMEQRREQFKMQEQAAQMQMFYSRQRPNHFHRKQRQHKNQQRSRQAPVNASEPIISQFQTKHQPKKSTKVPGVDSGVGSSVNSGNRSPVNLVPNPFYTGPPPVTGTTISPTGVKLVPNPFYTGPPTTCKPIVSPTGVKLVPNPFYQCNV